MYTEVISVLVFNRPLTDRMLIGVHPHSTWFTKPTKASQTSCLPLPITCSVISLSQTGARLLLDLYLFLLVVNDETRNHISRAKISCHHGLEFRIQYITQYYGQFDWTLLC